MADNVAYTPGSGAIIAADDIGGVLHQRIKLTMGPDGVNQGDVQGATTDPVGNELAMLVRTIAEENAYSQELLNTIAQILRSVWQMGSAAGAASLTVRNATAADLQTTATISGTPASNISQIGGSTAVTTTGNTSPANSANTMLVFAQSQQYHMPVLPEHIYFNIGV